MPTQNQVLTFRKSLVACSNWFSSCSQLALCCVIATSGAGNLDAQQIQRKLFAPPVNPAAITNLPASPAPLPITLANAFKLHSHPTASKVIFLDFDGFSTTGTAWNSNGNTIVTAPFSIDANPAFSSTELSMIQEIWQRVAECYSPFDVDVTTEQPPTADLVNSGLGDTRWGIRVCVGVSTPDPAPGAGGVAFVGSFTANSDTPCFVFPARLSNVSKFIADASVHEVGHTLGLIHDGRISPKEDYYYGQGSGPTGWAPHMGVGYERLLVQWSKGEYLSANNQEDDLAIITTLNGFGYRPDDYANDRTSATAIAGLKGTGSSASVFNINQTGLIALRTDSDWFKITTGSGTINLSAVGGTVNTMLDIQLDLYSSTGSLIVSSNPADLVTASISQNVTAGDYYVKIDGVGKGDPLVTGYTDYSSLGTYSISGTFPATSAAAGSVVKAVYSTANKSLTLTGDANANSVNVYLQAGLLKVEGANGTSIEARKEDGSLISKSSSYSVAHSGKLLFNANLGGGDDAISVIGVDSSTATINLGPGADKAAITLSSITTLNVDGGDGTDIVTVTSSTIGTFNKSNLLP